jgi:hypothetical protein
LKITFSKNSFVHLRYLIYKGATQKLLRSIMNKILLGALALLVTQAAHAQLRAHPVTLEGVIKSDTAKNGPVLLHAVVPVYSVYTTSVPTTQACTQTVCQDVPGNGTQGDWKGFFEAPKAQRAEKLAAAIKGVGIKSAVVILNNGFFRSKPRTWNAFSTEIRNAEAAAIAGGFKGHFAEQVISVYGSENSRNLGYYSATACTEVPSTCTVYVDQEKESFAYNLDRSILVDVRNTVLQSFESEPYSIDVGMDLNSVTVHKPSYYNNYQSSVIADSSNFSRVIIQGIGRNLVSLPNDTGSATLYKTDKGMTLQIAVNPNYLPKSDDSRSQLQIVTRFCHTNIFTGCHEEIQPWSPTRLTQPTYEIKFSGNLMKKGSKYKVWYKFKRPGSSFYDSSTTSEFSTDSVKFN